jgi:hypothetical protein
VSRHRQAAGVVEDRGAGPIGDPLLTPDEFNRWHAISIVREPTPQDGLWLVQLVDTLDRRQPARDVASYERGRVDERLYWRTRQQLQDQSWSGDPRSLAERLTPVTGWVGWAALAVLGVLVALLVLQARF